MDNLLKMKKKLYMLTLIVIPLILMFLLHMCIAIGEYFDISINISNVFAKDWFLFYASYLGGCMTLVGVIFSISNERKLNQFQISMEAIEKEKIQLASLINQINVFLPVTILQHFLGLAILKDGYDAKEIAMLRKMIIDGLNDVFKVSPTFCGVVAPPTLFVVDFALSLFVVCYNTLCGHTYNKFCGFALTNFVLDKFSYI